MDDSCLKKLGSAAVVVLIVLVVVCTMMKCDKCGSFNLHKLNSGCGCGCSDDKNDSKEGFHGDNINCAEYAENRGPLYQPGTNDEREYDLDIVGRDWNEITPLLALDPTVFDSQRAFVSDGSRTTTTASNVSVKEDDEGPVPRTGIRRVNYHGVFVDPAARTVPSEYPDQLGYSTRFLI